MVNEWINQMNKIWIGSGKVVDESGGDGDPKRSPLHTLYLFMCIYYGRFTHKNTVSPCT